MSTSDRIVAVLIAIVSVLMVMGLQRVIASPGGHAPVSLVDSRSAR